MILVWSLNPLINATIYLGLNVGALEKMALERDAAAHGLGVITAAIFLAGEMAGSGVLALPNAMIGTGKPSFERIICLIRRETITGFIVQVGLA